MYKNLTVSGPNMVQTWPVYYPNIIQTLPLYCANNKISPNSVKQARHCRRWQRAYWFFLWTYVCRAMQSNLSLIKYLFQTQHHFEIIKISKWVVQKFSKKNIIWILSKYWTNSLLKILIIILSKSVLPLAKDCAFIGSQDQPLCSNWSTRKVLKMTFLESDYFS